ncbi:type II toxin-antitoxin system HicB family antitoxin [Ralstonia sp. Ralssp135]|uniref:type II toxin-antitoxin system HicB family antitoxin n=1 Tax=Ralstonia sp. Ralssp135 TaxID=3243016 RepID=UPI0039B0E72B
MGLGLFYRHCRNRRAVLPAVRAALTCSTIEDLTRQDEYAGAIWAFVEIDDEELDRTPERINVSLPRFVLRKLDRFAEKRHETRSGLLARAAMALMAHG